MEMTNLYIKNLIKKMTLDQKVGAVLTLGFAGTVPRPHIYEFVEKYHCGGLRLSCDMRTFGSYVNPKSAKVVVSVENDNGIKYRGDAPVCTASEYKAVLDDLQEAARKRPLGIPLHFSYDQEGGTSADFCFGGVNLFPKPMGIRATNDAHLAYEVACAVAKQSKAVGFNWIHSPVLDVCSEPKNPEIYTRAYSDDAEVVSEYALETCRGFKQENMIATGKHFPGRGHSDIDAHFEVPVIDVDYETLQKRELLPYKRLIEKGCLPSIMIAHSIFPAIDPDNIATVSKKVVTGLLRNTLHFDGVITTDSMTMGAIATRYGVANACALALEAGADLVLMKAETDLVKDTIDAIKDFIHTGRITEMQLEEKVYRILNLKYEYGMFFDNTNHDEMPEKVLQDPAIKNLAKLVARRSVIVAKQQDSALPLCATENVLVVEQKVKGYNNTQWHSGILYEAILKYNPKANYVETSYTYDEEDKLRILAKAQQAETLVFTNYFIRGSLCNKDWLADFIGNTNKKVIVVTNTPFNEISIPENASNVVVTFATSPENIKVTAGVLFGKIYPEGVWPIEKAIL
ncbi:MAG: glycoside hydrolase family 3 protein [Oscillospiraceae bacterium]|nr:glycoside hydrolase family 3 protein [Oscillospiraceae bacterium]